MDWCAMGLTLRAMRGTETKQSSMLALMSPESVVPSTHPLRRVKVLADAVLTKLSPTFDLMYSGIGRPSIPPERLLKSMVLMALYSVRSERLLCEQLGYNLLFRWFLDMNMIEPAPDHSTFSRNRERLLEHDVAGEFFRAVVEQARNEKLMSDEHFTVDGTLIEAAASLKSFRPKDEPPSQGSAAGGTSSNRWVNFHGEQRSNATHQSTTDPEALLAKKGRGKEARLAYAGHALMKNHNGLLVDFQVTQATGTAERDAVPALIDQARERGFRPRTLGADKGYDTRACVADLRQRQVRPHVAQNTSGRRSAIDGRTTRHAGYVISQRIRKRVEEIFGWLKTTGGFRRTRYVGLDKTQMAGYLVGSAYNLVRMVRLLAAAQPA
jgi:transposase